MVVQLCVLCASARSVSGLFLQAALSMVFGDFLKPLSQ
jgi:hypothetical protein